MDNKPFDIPKILRGRSASEFKPIPGGLIYTDETPSHRFTTVIVPLPRNEYVLVLSTRDFFDEDLATAVISDVLKGSSSLSTSETVRVLEGFSHKGYAFDSLAVLSPAAANQFKHEHEQLNERAFVAFPIHRCELSGNESAEVLDVIRHDFLPTLDWKRRPCPKVTMAFSDPGTGTKTTKPGLTSIQNVRLVAERLAQSDGGWIEIENYLCNSCTIRSSRGRFVVQMGGESSLCDLPLLLERITSFLVGGGK